MSPLLELFIESCTQISGSITRCYSFSFVPRKTGFRPTILLEITRRCHLRSFRSVCIRSQVSTWIDLTGIGIRKWIDVTGLVVSVHSPEERTPCTYFWIGGSAKKTYATKKKLITKDKKNLSASGIGYFFKKKNAWVFDNDIKSTHLKQGWLERRLNYNDSSNR